jgi:hypothetical protein
MGYPFITGYCSQIKTGEYTVHFILGGEQGGTLNNNVAKELKGLTWEVGDLPNKTRLYLNCKTYQALRRLTIPCASVDGVGQYDWSFPSLGVTHSIDIPQPILTAPN